MSEALPIIAAALGGVLPALAWLWFWLHEDRSHPEPRKLIALAFFAGMLAVAIVVPLEQFVARYVSTIVFLFVAWATIEEVLKYAAARFTVLYRRENDEPIDAVVYMVTVALGFAAAENALFLWSPISGTTLLQTILTGDLRFVGATLLHVLASATIGIALAFSYYKPKRLRRFYALGGVILASSLHALFNIFIISTPDGQTLRVFTFVWVGLIAVLALLEIVKRMRPRRV